MNRNRISLCQGHETVCTVWPAPVVRASSSPGKHCLVSHVTNAPVSHPNWSNGECWWSGLKSRMRERLQTVIRQNLWKLGSCFYSFLEVLTFGYKITMMRHCCDTLQSQRVKLYPWLSGSPSPVLEEPSTDQTSWTPGCPKQLLAELGSSISEPRTPSSRQRFWGVASATERKRIITLEPPFIIASQPLK